MACSGPNPCVSSYRSPLAVTFLTHASSRWRCASLTPLGERIRRRHWMCRKGLGASSTVVKLNDGERGIHGPGVPGGACRKVTRPIRPRADRDTH